MLHFVLADINPNKAKKFKPFLKEMNEITMLITVAGGPHVTHKSLIKNKETGVALLDISEGDFEVKFKGQLNDGVAVSGYFEVFEDKKRLLEISYSIREGEAIALRVKLNCEGEYLVREELERAFERDFSQEAHEMMDTPLEELRKPIVQDTVEEIQEPTPSQHELPGENEISSHEEITEPTNAQEDAEEIEEIAEELTELTQKVEEALLDTRSMIAMLNNLSHDITRGGTVNFGERKTNMKTLENGAVVEMIDDESSDYRITFRKGSLDQMVEVSFFLEKENELIFSVYFSSEGVGKIATTSSQGNIILNKVKYHLL